MTPVDIDKLKELLAKATPGPLYSGTRMCGEISICSRHPERTQIIASFRPFSLRADDVAGDAERDANAALYIATINSLPALIAKAERVDALERVVNRIRADASGRDALPLPSGGRDAHRNVALSLSGLLSSIEHDARNALSPKESE